MVHSDVFIRNIAVATDFTPWSDRATRHGLFIARQFGAVVHFLHAVRRSEFSFIPDLMISLDELAERDSHELISHLKSLKELDSIETRCWNVDGEIADVFADLISKHSIDLLVVGTRARKGLSKFLSGSIAEEICHNVSCPVLTVGPWSRDASRDLVLHRVLFASDLSRESRAAIPYVLTAARTWGAEIDLLHVRSALGSDSRLTIEEFGRAIEDARRGQPLPSLRYHTATGKLSDEVLEFARQNRDGLIALGMSRDRSLYGSRSSSDAYDIICRATCPVLSVSSATATEHQTPQD